MRSLRCVRPTPTHTSRVDVSDDSFSLTLGDVMRAAGIREADAVVIRHTPDRLASAGVAGPQALLDYTRWQKPQPRFGARWWIVFIADGGRRSRLAQVYENFGVLGPTEEPGYVLSDLRPSLLLSTLRDRLVVEWAPSAVAWAVGGAAASPSRIVEIADRRDPFPGYDSVVMSYAELRAVIVEPRFELWRTALSAVKGVYLIVDGTDGRQYVGKADGARGILQRWEAYAINGHGDDVELKSLLDGEPARAGRFTFSLLRVLDPQTPQHVIDAAEAHFKRALGTRLFGLNRN